ncbi:MAG: hypothetical protein SVY10_17490 [Thermodesulfobacteriota bacterium]|nr:hypothetical protein [Thermodesulfobacteriota bacterium]
MRRVIPNKALGKCHTLPIKGWSGCPVAPSSSWRCREREEE